MEKSLKCILVYFGDFKPNSANFAASSFYEWLLEEYEPEYLEKNKIKDRLEYALNQIEKKDLIALSIFVLKEDCKGRSRLKTLLDYLQKFNDSSDAFSNILVLVDQLASELLTKYSPVKASCMINL